MVQEARPVSSRAEKCHASFSIARELFTKWIFI
jgi:hypothetical protein